MPGVGRTLTPMTTSRENAGPPPDSVYAVWALNAAAYIVLIVYSVTGDDPWPGFWVGLAAFIIAGAHFFWLRSQGRYHPMALSCWAGGLSALAWSIGLLAAWY